ncbi:MAG: hypothetical protein QOI92_996 [Chloroflexota bacterium]|jgi:hypothetical protein|nr:hypothetical protein [Chloroflexota bacterium]
MTPSSTDFDMLADATLADAYPRFAQLRATGAAHWSESRGAWFVRRYEDV